MMKIDEKKDRALNRVLKILDANTFVEIKPRSKEDTEGVKTGYGKINGRTVFIYSQNFNYIGGSLGKLEGQKIVTIQKLARENGSPIVAILDGVGARIQEGIASLEAYGAIFRENCLSSGVIPQISIAMGPCAGGAVYSPAMTDIIYMVKDKSHMFITGPMVIEKTTGEIVSIDDLGGDNIHTTTTGLADGSFESEEEAMEATRQLLSYLPQNNMGKLPFTKNNDNKEKSCILSSIIPTNKNQSYDIKDIINEICDDNSFFELKNNFAKNVVTGLARIENKTVGIIANQPKYLAGSLDIDSSDKIARFVRFCDSFSIPLINLVDVPGYLPGISQEQNGIIRHGAKVLYAYSEATVPKIAVIIRKAYGGAYIALASKLMSYDSTAAWENADVAVMGQEQSESILFREKKPEEKDELREKIKNLSSLTVIKKEGYIDEIINPDDTRRFIIDSLNKNKVKEIRIQQKKHGNIPL